MSDFFGNLAADAAKGAGVGAALGPIGAGVGAAVSVVGDIADAVGLTRWLFGPQAAPIKAAVDQAVQAVTGTADVAAQGLALADPAKAADLRIRLAEIAAEQEARRDAGMLASLQASLADVQNARGSMVTLAGATGWTAHLLALMPALVALLILGVWGYTMIYGAVMSEGDRITTNNVLLIAVSFWLGSSMGSQRKDAR